MPIMLVLVVVVTSSAPSCLFIPRSYGYAKLPFLVPSLPCLSLPGPHETFPKTPQIQAAKLPAQPGFQAASDTRLPLRGSHWFRSGASQPVAALRLDWRILSGRATSAAGRRLDPQGELAPPAVLLCSLVKLLLAGVRVRPTSE